MLNQPYLIEASLILVISYVLYRLLFANDKAFTRNRIYLLTALIFAVVIPLLSFPVFAREIISNPLNPLVNSEPIVSPLTESSFDWMALIPILYWAGVILLSLRLIYHFSFIAKVLKTSEVVIKDDVKFVITDQLTSPASIFNNVIVEEINIPQEIINHEKIHIAHGHTWDVLLLEVMKVIFWFNPFIYLLSRCLKDNHEYTADHLAAQSLENELDYSEILIEYAKSSYSPILLNTFSSITKKRIIMLSKKKSKNIIKPFLMFTLFAAIFTMFSCEQYNVDRGTQGSEITKNIEDFRLDTIVTFDADTGAESIQIERVYPNDLREITDTTIIFNSDTYEEQVQIVKSESPRKEIIKQTYTTNEYNNRTGDLETKTYNRYPQELVESTDTVITFNYDNYEEQLEVVKVKMPREELVSKKVTPKNQIKAGQKYDNVITEKNKVTVKKKGN